MTVTVEPVTPVLGAEVSGVDLASPVPADQQDALRQALADHLVLFFRTGVDLTEDQQLAFASVFGPPVSSSATDDDADLLFVTLEDSAESPPKSDRWHTDVPFVPQPPDVAVLQMRETPAAGGDTMWASLYAAFESLSPVLQERLALLELDLGLGTSADTIRELYGEEYHRQVLDRFPGARHPLVRQHPVTGKPALYLCGSFMKGIVGMHPDESDVLLRFLASRLDDPNLQCRWRWQQFDVAVWDERCTNHRGLSDHFPNRRVIRRCLAGRGTPIPFSVPAARPTRSGG